MPKKRPGAISFSAVDSAIAPAIEREEEQTTKSAEELDTRFDAPKEFILAHAKRLLAANPSLALGDLMHKMTKDIRNINGDPCSEVFNPSAEIMKIAAQNDIIKKLEGLVAAKRGGRRRRRKTKTKRKRKTKRRGRGKRTRRYRK